MNYQEFATQIARLTKTYGGHCYPVEVIDALYEEIGHINQAKFRRAITLILADNPNPKYPQGLTKLQVVLAKLADEDQYKRHEKRGEKLKGIKDTKKIGDAFAQISKEVFGEK